MENATKALVIAGSVLLSIIVLSIFMLMVNSLTDYQQAQNQMGQTQDVISFNNQFQGYMRDDVAGTDVLSVINKVLYYNRNKAIDAVGKDDAGNGYVYEPITLVVEMNGNQGKLSMNVNDNKLFKKSTYSFATDKNDQEMDETFEIINNLLNKTEMPTPPESMSAGGGFMPDQYTDRKPIYYTEGILKGLMDNYGSSNSIFEEVATDSSDPNKSKNEKNKRFKEFNRIVGTVYFPLFYADNKGPIKEQQYDKWWERYFKDGASATSSIEGVSGRKTIKEVLAYYYEYAQFQRGKFKYVQPSSGEETYSSSSGRIKYLKFEFTGDFI